MTIDANLLEGFKLGCAFGALLGFCVGCWLTYAMLYAKKP